MGKPSSTDADLAAAAWTGTLASAAAGPWVGGLVGAWNLAVSGAFVATLVLEASFDGGATAHQVPNSDGTAFTATAPGLWQVRQEEDGVLHRVRASAHTSGTAAVRLSGGRRGQ